MARRRGNAGWTRGRRSLPGRIRRLNGLEPVPGRPHARTGTMRPGTGHGRHGRPFCFSTSGQCHAARDPRLQGWTVAGHQTVLYCISKYHPPFEAFCNPELAESSAHKQVPFFMSQDHRKPAGGRCPAPDADWLSSIEVQAGRMRERIVELAEINSGSDNTAGVNRVGETLAGYFAALGAKAERHTLPAATQVGDDGEVQSRPLGDAFVFTQR